MGYRLGGWVQFVVEVRWTEDPMGDGDPLGQFIRGVNELMGLRVLPASAGGESLGAIVEGQSEHTQWVEYAGPAQTAGFMLMELNTLCARVFGAGTVPRER